MSGTTLLSGLQDTDKLSDCHLSCTGPMRAPGTAEYAGFVSWPDAITSI